MKGFGSALVKGFLHTEGTKIVNGDGEEIILQGYGCGNWTNPEGFMVGGPKDIELKGGIFSPNYIPPRRFDRRRTFNQVLQELCGTEYARNFWPVWYRNHLGEDDIRAMASLGLNSVRLPINAVTLLEEEPGLVWNEDGFKMLDDVIDWCEKYRIYAILDLHAAPGGQSATACDGGLDNYPHLYMDDESWDRALAIWERLAKRYADRWIVGGYDLLNEPVSLPNHRFCVPKLAQFYDEAIARIRQYDTKHMFTLEGSCFSRSNEIFDHDYDPGYHNWCIHVHIYGASPERRELYPYLLKGMEYNVPVWIGEGGASDTVNTVFFDIAADYGIGFNLWCWKTAMEKDGMTRAVCYHLPKDWEIVRAYFSGAPKPSYAKSIAVFDELLENVKYKNCVHNKESIRISRKIPPLNLPAVGYDNLPGDGKSFVGSWNYGNLLNYRLEDRTKLVWLPGIEEPRPGFEMYPDENIQRPFNPLDVLMLELAEGEFAVYTVYEPGGGCTLSIDGRSIEGEGRIDIYYNDTLEDSVILSEALSAYPAHVCLPEEKCVKVKLCVAAGCVQIKTLKFGGGAYEKAL